MSGDDSGGGGFEVVGGAHGLEADLDDMDATGSRIRATGWDVGDTALDTHRFLVDGNLLRSAPLAPTTFARFEGSLVAALDGPDGLGVNAVRMVATGTFMQGKSRAYLATDRALEQAVDVRQHLQGQLYGLGLQVAPVPTLLTTYLALEDAGALDDPATWLTEHPDVLEEVVASSSGALDVFLPGAGFPFGTEDGAALLSLLYDQELGELTSQTVDGTAAPQSLHEAMVLLEEAAGTTDGFRVERIGTGPDARYVVYLPGTKAFDGPFEPGGPLPDGLEESGLVQNLGTNFAAVGGVDNAYVTAVLRALDDLPAGADVTLLGHSQGGIVAARVAEAVATAEDPPVRVRRVVTAGSPVDHIELPEGVQVLSLVNEHDIVPRLDGEAVDDRSNHTTVLTRRQLGSVTDNHSVGRVYAPLAADLEASDDHRAQAAVDGLREVWSGGTSTTTFYEMGRP